MTVGDLIESGYEVIWNDYGPAHCRMVVIDFLHRKIIVYGDIQVSYALYVLPLDQ